MSHDPANLNDALRTLDEQVDERRRLAQKRRFATSIQTERSSFLSFSALAVAAGLAILVGFIVTRDGTGGASRKAEPVAVHVVAAPAAREDAAAAPVAPITPEQPPVAVAQRVVLARGVSMLLAEGARARGLRTGPRKFQVQLEDGKVDLGIEQRTISRVSWVILAGQYRVQAQAAIFSVSNEADSQQLHLQVDRGRALISGGGMKPRHVEAGEELRARAPVAQRGRSPHTSHEPTAGSDEPAESWRTLYEAGRYAEALALAKRSGLTANASRLDARDLTDLADVARLARVAGEARALLLTLRERYPDSRGAREGAFLLGRMAADGTRDTAGAERWFTTYLHESPSGTYAQEALGRLLTLASQSGDQARARAYAERYLVRFPGGPYASLARSLTH